MSDGILRGLNESQKAAVSSASRTVAILAGPGSGKTHTLTSRTAWLLKHEGYEPWNIIVATFTVKAAREMKERIGKLIGDGMESKLILGTFHSIARRYLSRYGHLIEIKKDFGIADSNDSLAMLKRIVKKHRLSIDAKVARTRISSTKAKGGIQTSRTQAKKTMDTQEFEICYAEYEDALKRSNLLDYDDLLLRCVDLLREYPSCVSNIEAVLIDEFQDTNVVQFDLMRLFAAQRKRVTIVGDPDQSIYGFRSAETKNFKRMTTQYPDTITIPLEENYRSSGAILLTALEVIRQDGSRIDKSLLATHTIGTQPVLRKVASAHKEADWIVSEIRRALVLTGNLMDYSDVAILLRSSQLSRILESSLGKAGIPYRMVGGFRFYDRVEVKLVLDYLRVVSQPENNDAFARIINVPSRRIGAETINSLLAEADHRRITLWALVLDIVQGNLKPNTRLSKQAEQGISSLINIVLTCRKKMADLLTSPVEMIETIVKKIQLEEYLEKIYPDEHEGRMANIQELIIMATEFSEQLDDSDALPNVDELEQQDLSQPLSKFLANIALTSEIITEEGEQMLQSQVTISTIHAAKGLEWPIVFIPATYQGSIPHSRAEDDDEERRLLYVAMTRAKALLYLSYPLKNSSQDNTTICCFLTSKSLKPYFAQRGPSFISETTQTIAQILRRPFPTFDMEAVARLEHKEDSQYVCEEGEEDDLMTSRYDEDWSGHHYTKGQQVVKRRRLIDSKEAPTTTSKPSYTATLGQASSFTIAAVAEAAKAGFMSAGSHMQVLSEKSVDCIADTQRQPRCSRADPDMNSSKKLIPARPTKRSTGQSSIASFFAVPGGISSAQSGTRARSVVADKKSLKSNPIVSPLPTPRQAKVMPSSFRGEMDMPTLGHHRVNTTAMPHPTKRLKEEEAPSLSGKPYNFLSSSPQAAESLIRDAEADINEDFLVHENLQERGKVALQQVTQPSKSTRPAKIFHTTTITAMNTLKALPPQRKTLGIRRSMNGWADRMNQ